MRRTTWPLALLLALFAACGSSSSSDPDPAASPSPTAVPTVTPRPTPGCGNGIVDDGEFCDGQAFCPADCSVVFSACCEYRAPAGDESFCGQLGFPSPRACNESGGRFSLGTTCQGSSCNEEADVCDGDGRCASMPIDPVSVCCQLEGSCEDDVFTDTGALAQFAFWDCGVGPQNGRAVLGVCGDAGACVPPD